MEDSDSKQHTHLLSGGLKIVVDGSRGDTFNENAHQKGVRFCYAFLLARIDEKMGEISAGGVLVAANFCEWGFQPFGVVVPSRGLLCPHSACLNKHSEKVDVISKEKLPFLAECKRGWKRIRSAAHVRRVSLGCEVKLVGAGIDCPHR